MEFELMASMMCADYSKLGEEVKELDEGGIDSFHIDIMDGRYVHNFAILLYNNLHINFFYILNNNRYTLIYVKDK